METSVSVKRGVDPMLEKRKARVQNFRAFLKEMYGPHVMSHQKRGDQTLRRIQTQFSDYLDLPLTELNQWKIETWRRQRKLSGIEAATINRDLNTLKAALAMAVEWEVIAAHPLKKLKPLKVIDSEIVRFLSIEEEERLRNALDNRERCMREARGRGNLWRSERGYAEYNNLLNVEFVDGLKPRVLFSLLTGLRRGELFQLKWDNVNSTFDLLTIPGSYTKNGRTRHIPLCIEAKNLICKWKQQNVTQSSTLIFPGQVGKPLTWIRTAWVNLLKQSQIECFRWHDLRHHFASRLVIEGIDLNTVRELLGHKDIKMTLRYAHLSPQVKIAAVAKFDLPRGPILNEKSS
jgi:integrase